MTGQSALAQARPPQPAPPPKPAVPNPFKANSLLAAWEYYCVEQGNSTATEITIENNRLGSYGWELVTSAGAGAGDNIKFIRIVSCFKRRP